MAFFIKFFVYILHSELFDKYYVGQTNNLEERINRHNSGYEKSTAPYKPWEIALYIIKDNRSEAMILEKKIKNLSKDRLKAFIEKYK